MTPEQKANEIKYLRVALNLQNIAINERTCDQIIVTLDKVRKKRGKFNLHDAVEIELAIERKYKEKELTQ